MPARAYLTGVLLLAGCLASCSKPAEPPAASGAQPVRTATVALPTQAEPLTVVGRIAGKEELELAFKISGIIQQISVSAGQAVKAGELLASLDSTEIDARVSSARAQADKAARDLARAEELARKGVVPVQALQDARSQQELAQAALDTARFDQSHARITAPADGIILARRAEARETVAAGSPVLAMTRADSGWLLRAGLPDRLATRVQPGDPATVQVDGLPGQSLAGTVAFVGAASDPRTGTVAAEIHLTDPGQKLVSGWIGRATLQAGRHGSGQAVTVPPAAILEASGDRGHVFVVNPGQATVQRVEVTVGRLLPDGIEVTRGLEAGQTVVTEGAAWLRDGDPIVIMP